MDRITQCICCACILAAATCTVSAKEDPKRAIKRAVQELQVNAKAKKLEQQRDETERKDAIVPTKKKADKSR